jgi:coenzyme F420-reducing hydrogenase delta subunit
MRGALIVSLIVALSACAVQEMGANPTDGLEQVSFSDGSSTCRAIEVAATASRYDISDALVEGADAVEVHGCVNFVFTD